MSLQYTPTQLQAITAEVDTLTRDGAGSGKTRMLTGRYLHLRQQEIPAEQIVAVTFTEAAGQELNHRFRQSLGESPQGSVIGTIHALCKRIAQAHPVESGVPLQLQVMDDAATENWYAAHLPQALTELNPSRLSELPPDMRQTWLQRLLQEPHQTQAALAASLAAEAGPGHKARQHQQYVQVLQDVYPQLSRTLQGWRAAQGLATYGDLEEWAARALEHETVRTHFAARWKYLLLDEAQDINPVQWAVLQALWHPAMRLTIVGDVQQAIYGFRGADLRMFEAMRQAVRARGGLEIELSASYRSDPGLVTTINQAFTALRAQRPSSEGLVPFLPLQAARPPAPQPALFEGDCSAGGLAKRKQVE